MKKRVLLLFCFVMALCLIPTIAFADSTPLEELRITSDTTSVTAGVLPDFTASTTTEHADVGGYPNTNWSKSPSGKDWEGFGGAIPTAINDGTTHYGLRLAVFLDDGYCFDSNTKLYFNDIEIENIYPNLSIFSWGGYVIVDLGLATGEVVIHNVTFDANGGDSSRTDIVADGEKATKPYYDPTRYGYSFAGWYTDEACTNPFDFSTPITADITLYAKWTELIKLEELRLTSTTTSVTAGVLPDFTASTTTEHAVVEGYPNTNWSKSPSGKDWEGFGGAIPTAVNDGTTRYGLRLAVFVDDGYRLDNSTKLYFNDTEIVADIYNLSIFSWGGYVIVDLGLAKCPHVLKTTTEKATAVANGEIVTKCELCGEVISAKDIYAARNIKLSATTYTYNGKISKPTVKVKNSEGKTLKEGTDYTVTYASGCKAVGKYKVTIKGKGNYSFTKSLYFKINPVKTSITSLTKGTKSFTVKWSKKITQTTGYEIQYSTSSTFKSGTATKKVIVKSNKTTSKTIKSLKAKKKYYVRVRTYKTVNGNKYYSGWCTKKYVTTK